MIEWLLKFIFYNFFKFSIDIESFKCLLMSDCPRNYKYLSHISNSLSSSRQRHKKLTLIYVLWFCNWQQMYLIRKTDLRNWLLFFFEENQKKIQTFSTNNNSNIFITRDFLCFVNNYIFHNSLKYTEKPTHNFPTHNFHSFPKTFLWTSWSFFFNTHPPIELGIKIHPHPPHIAFSNNT